MLAILTCSGSVGGTGEDGGEGDEAGGGVGGGGIRRILCLIRWIALRGETFVSSSSPLRGDKIKGLFLGPLFPSFL